jgi:hypothetical protein
MVNAGTDIDVTPSVGRMSNLSVATTTELKDGTADAIGYFVATEGPVPAELGLDRAALAACGFDGNVGKCLLVPGGELVKVAVGYGAHTRSKPPGYATRRRNSRVRCPVGPDSLCTWPVWPMSTRRWPPRR